MSATDGAYGTPKVTLDAPTVAAIQVWLPTDWVAMVTNTVDGELWYVPKVGVAYKAVPAGVTSIAGEAGVVTLAEILAAMLLREVREEIPSAAGPFVLTNAPGASRIPQVFFDGILQQASSYTIIGTAFTLVGVDHTLVTNITVIYSY